VPASKDATLIIDYDAVNCSVNAISAQAGKWVLRAADTYVYGRGSTGYFCLPTGGEEDVCMYLAA
jgi:hypothetical protein